MAGEPDNVHFWLLAAERPVIVFQVLVGLRITWEIVNMQNSRPTPDTLIQDVWCDSHNSVFLISSKEVRGHTLRNVSEHHFRTWPHLNQQKQMKKKIQSLKNRKQQ